MLLSCHYQYVGDFLMHEVLWMFVLHHADPLSIGSHSPVVCQLLSPASLFSSLFSALPVPSKEDGNMWDWTAVGISQHNNTKFLLVSCHTPLKKHNGNLNSHLSCSRERNNICYILKSMEKEKETFLDSKIFLTVTAFTYF